MILSIMDSLENFFDEVGKFVGDNYGSFIFWIAVFGIILALGIYTISKFANK